MSKEEAETILRGWLDVKKVVWFPDHKPDFWTDGQIDGCLKFILTREFLFELSTEANEVGASRTSTSCCGHWNSRPTQGGASSK
jgi:agmatine/peptidylarginine deiminase